MEYLGFSRFRKVLWEIWMSISSTPQVMCRPNAGRWAAQVTDTFAHQAHFHLAKLCHSNPIPVLEQLLVDLNSGYQRGSRVVTNDSIQSEMFEDAIVQNCFSDKENIICLYSDCIICFSNSRAGLNWASLTCSFFVIQCRLRLWRGQRDITGHSIWLSGTTLT